MGCRFSAVLVIYLVFLLLTFKYINYICVCIATGVNVVCVTDVFMTWMLKDYTIYNFMWRKLYYTQKHFMAVIFTVS